MKINTIFRHSAMLLLPSLLTTLLVAQQISVPITPVSFPKEALPIDAGRIEFYAKLSGFSGDIPVGGDQAPYFFTIRNGETHAYFAGFNSNDGAGNGGLTGGVGNSFRTGTGLFDSWTYEDVLGEGKVADWHHYAFQWNKDGIPRVSDGKQKLAIFIDGVLNSSIWSIVDGTPGTFEPFSSCPTLNLITLENPGSVSGEVAIDEFKIFDGNNKLILHNKLGSPSEIENSAVGPDGTYKNVANVHFVPGISGNAVMSQPIYSLGTADCPSPEDDKCFAGNSKNQKVEICHKGKTICVSEHAVAAHLKHGDSRGRCSANEETNTGLAISPNPSRGQVTVQYNCKSAGKVQLKVYDLSGATVFYKTDNAIKGKNTYQLNLSSLYAGSYYIELNDGSGQQRMKFVIQK
jgi:hypothetical protein